MKNFYISSLLLLIITISCVYSNTLDSSWHFDDKPNILDNTALHMETLSFESFWKASFSRAGHRNYRPLPNLSFAINWYIGGNDTTGYHLTNIIIHCASAFFLLLSCIEVFKSPGFIKRYTTEHARSVSLLTAVLWAIHPIQTQSVTYIVQRMTSMAAMFYMGALFLYMKGRNQVLLEPRPDAICAIEKGRIRMMQCFLFSSFFYLCAIFSKENAVILPVSIFLIEILFFRDLSKLRTRWKMLSVFILLFVGVAVAGVVVFTKCDFLFFIKRYSYRPFTIWERLLTEPGILVHYLSQIFYPLPGRFSLVHDVVISKNIFQPWTTIVNIALIFAAISCGFLLSRKHPVWSLAILFYFLNHIIESTVIPLELFFEHRNYLPSMFLFLPVALAISNFLKRFNDKKMVYFFILLTIPIVIFWFGMNTYNRNSIWKSELTLWHDAFKKAPNDARAATSLAIALSSTNNHYFRNHEVALKLFEKAILLNKTQSAMNAEIYGNMAGIYYSKGQYKKAYDLHRKSLEINPQFIKGRFDLVKTLVMMGDWDKASRQLDVLLESSNRYLVNDFYKVKGHILLWQNRPEDALIYFRKVFRIAPWNQDIFFEIGRSLSMAGYYWNAEWFLSSYYKKNTKNIFAALCLIENSINAGHMALAEKYAENMLANNDIISINSILEASTSFYQSVPISSEVIKPIIKKKIMELSGFNDKVVPNCQ